jgi:hypothetical protein
MPAYYFQLRDRSTPLPPTDKPREFPDLRTALAEAQSAARSLIHKRVRRAPIELHGTFDILDQRRQPVARILLADIARQIS